MVECDAHLCVGGLGSKVRSGLRLDLGLRLRVRVIGSALRQFEGESYVLQGAVHHHGGPGVAQLAERAEVLVPDLPLL